MKAGFCRNLAIASVATVVTACALPAYAQDTASKDKPPLYTYVANWVIPRAHWDEMAKSDAANQKILDDGVAGGSILGYGNDEILVHQVERETHNNWWVANSMAGVLKVLDQFYKVKSPPVLATATKHWDNIYVSRSYNWRAGTIKSGYVHGAVYKLKADAPDNAVEVLSKSFIVPLFEKLMSEGAVQAYQVAEEAVHTTDPGMFFIFFISPNADGLDKTNAALSAAVAENALAGPAFASMVDFSAHRDNLARGDAVLK
jgi:hypothetical protein